MTPEAVRETGAEIVLANTYHLMLRPGAERVAKLGGLHAFMNWPGPILTDSGGFQVMSLAKLRHIDERGVTFQSHLDGSRHALSPERCMEIQGLLGSDIAMVLDECTPFPAEQAEAAKSMRLSLRWAARCRQAFEERPGHALFGIVQGGVHEALRRESAAALAAIGFDGYAVGGLAVGEGQAEMFRVLDATVPGLPENRPRYLMGVGKPDDIVGAVRRGIDMFDCVLPTRSGRTAQAFTRGGAVNLRNARHAEDPRLPAPFGEERRDSGRRAADLAQPPLLPGPDGRAARRHRCRHPRRSRRPVRGKPGAGGYSGNLSAEATVSCGTHTDERMYSHM
jgi:queuine tRNA-ribosyltransferase